MYICVPFLSKYDNFFNKSKYVAHRFATSPHFQEQNTSEIRRIRCFSGYKGGGGSR